MSSNNYHNYEFSYLDNKKEKKSYYVKIFCALNGLPASIKEIWSFIWFFGLGMRGQDHCSHVLFYYILIGWTFQLEELRVQTKLLAINHCRRML